VAWNNKSLTKISCHLFGSLFLFVYLCSAKSTLLRNNLNKQIMATEVKKSELHKALISSGKCKTDAAAEKKIAGMRAKVANGSNPETILHNIGLEPDYVFDLL
jgi:hypothetical protein